MKVKLTISVLAKKAGIGIETIRYYQRLGLIFVPEKPEIEYRLYSENHIADLMFIRRAKSMRFSLAEIAKLLALKQNQCAEASSIAHEKLKVIEEKIADLSCLADDLKALLAHCRDNVLASCLILKKMQKIVDSVPCYGVYVKYSFYQ